MTRQLQIAMDVMGYLFTTVPILATWSLTFLFFTKGSNEFLLWFTPVFAVFALAFFIFLLRVIIPKPQKGVIDVGFNNQYLGWYMNLCLLRAFLSSGLRPLILSMAWSRYLIFKALGADIPYNFQMAMNSEITDLTLVTIGEGCLIGDHSKITGHYIAKDKIILRPVYLAPGTIIPPHSTVKPGTKTEPDQIYGKGKTS